MTGCTHFRVTSTHFRLRYGGQSSRSPLGEMPVQEAHIILKRFFMDAVPFEIQLFQVCLLYTSDAADERSSVDLGGRRIIKKKKKEKSRRER